MQSSSRTAVLAKVQEFIISIKGGLGPDLVTEETRLIPIGQDADDTNIVFDSLDALELSILIEDEFALPPIQELDLDAFATVGDVVSFVLANSSADHHPVAHGQVHS